jgi:hypothetical protein
MKGQPWNNLVEVAIALRRGNRYLALASYLSDLAKMIVYDMQSNLPLRICFGLVIWSE